jgi:hypothetical protein
MVMVRDRATPSNFVLHPLEPIKQGHYKVPTLNAVIVNNTLKYTPIGHVVENVKTRRNTNPIRIPGHLFPGSRLAPRPSQTSTVNKQVKQPTLEIPLISKVVSCKPETPSQSQVKRKKFDSPVKNKPKDSQEKPSSTTKVATQPVMSNRVDWEDKIPMDVISFVVSSK